MIEFRRLYSVPLLVIALHVALPKIGWSQEKEDATETEVAQPPRPIEITDVADWQQVAGFQVSPDGTWCGYLVRSNEGDGTVIIRQVAGDGRHEFEVGPSSSSPSFSHDNNWAAFRSAALEKDAKAAEKTNKPAPSKIVLVNLTEGTSHEFEGANGFTFSGENAQWMAIEKVDPRITAGNAEIWSGTDLLLHHLTTGKQINFGNVSRHAFNKAGNLLAMTIDAQGKLGNGLQLFDTTNQQVQVLENDKAIFKNLSWNRDGNALALLKETEDDKYEEKLHQLIAYRDVGTSAATRVHIDPLSDDAIPADMTISPNRSPAWTEARDAVIFGIHDARPKPEEEEKEEEEDKDDDEDAGLVIWHWQDKRLQSRQQVQESADKRFNFLCVHQVEAGTTIRVANDDMRQASTSRPHRFALAFDNTQYERTGNLDGKRFQDVYSIDLRSGERKLVLPQNRWQFGISPSGDRLLYYENAHFHVLNLVNGRSTNITENVPVSFVDSESDYNVENPPIRPRGWTEDGDAVILHDNWDLWLVPVAGGEAINLTGNGRTDEIRYRSIYDLDPEEPGIDLSGPAYVSAYGEWTKKAGIGLISGMTGSVEMLLWDDAAIGALRKVEDHEVYYYTKSTHDQATTFFVGGPGLDDATQVTEVNQQQDKFLWSAGGRLIEYEGVDGERLQAALFLPAGYVEGKSYPTVVYIYEKLSQRLNNYDAPRVGGFSKSIYTSRGYAVLMPDIVYRINDPGLSAVECVVPAVEAAIASGVVDREKIGLHGHSWGGYQTSFLITQTDLFAAAVAGAPLTNLISMYSSIYWNSGGPNQPIFESSQGRFTGGYWANLRAYARNSPVYYARRVNTPLLLLHNDEDGAVDWNQGIEYFNTLRRLDKPVVMLQYVGENHGLAKLPNRKDYSYRMLDFFDHYLKDQEAAKWWADGIDHLDMKEHIRNYRRENEQGE